MLVGVLGMPVGAAEDDPRGSCVQAGASQDEGSKGVPKAKTPRSGVGATVSVPAAGQTTSVTVVVDCTPSVSQIIKCIQEAAPLDCF